MISTLIASIVALVVTAALTPLVRRAALAVGAVDEPTARRVHTRRVPRMGGIAIVAGTFLPLLALFALNTSLARIFFGAPRVVGGLVIGALMVAGLGLLDDIVGVGAKRKLLVQSIAACAAYAGGLRIGAINLPLVGMVQLGWLALPATVLWITGVVNALNLIDGLDGLAAGIAFFACLTNFIVAFLSQNILICLLSATLAGAILGFLIYNFNPATIFMGDSGSMFLGFMLATTSLMGAASQKSPTVIAIVVPLLALGLPIVDMLFAIARRFLERRPIFSPDRGHIHHRLLDLGITHRRAVLILYGLSLTFTAVALAIHLGRSWQIGVALLVLTAALAGVVRFVGYFNSVMAQNGQRRNRDACTTRLRTSVPKILPRIEGAPSVDELPALLERFARESELLAVEIVPGEGAKARAFRWEAVEPGDARAREAVCAKYEVSDALGVRSEIAFYWDSPDGAAGPQPDILLQLVADAAEALLQRAARARAASRSGRLRPIA